VSIDLVHLWGLLELLLGWVLFVYGVLRLAGRVAADRPGRLFRGSLALIAGVLFLVRSCYYPWW
jgi:hypothetical protein